MIVMSYLEFLRAQKGVDKISGQQDGKNRTQPVFQLHVLS
jgi:hypothetical protein